MHNSIGGLLNINKDLKSLPDTTAEMVMRWGKTPLYPDKTLSMVLSIEGISLWEIVAPSLAYTVSKVLQNEKGKSGIIGIKHALGRYKHFILRTKRRIFHANNRIDNWPHGNTVLVLGFSPYMFRDVLSPVVSELVRLESGKVSPVIFSDSIRKSDFFSEKEYGMTQSIWQYYDGEVVIKAIQMVEEYNSLISEIKRSNIITNIINNEKEELRPDLIRLFDYFIYARFPVFIEQIAIAHSVIKKHKPDVLLSCDVSDPRARVYFLACKAAKIPSIMISYGLFDKDAFEWKFFVGDRIVVQGLEVKTVMLEHGIPAERLDILGSPRYDCHYIDQSLNGEEHKTLKSHSGKKRILFASQPIYSYFTSKKIFKIYIDFIKTLFNSVTSMKDISLVVKPHPLEDEKYLKELASGNAKIIFAKRSDDIRKLIMECDVFITYMSTAAIDALLSNKTVINILINGLESHIFNENSGTLIARTNDDLSLYIKAIADGTIDTQYEKKNEERMHFLEKWTYRNDGLASRRIVDLILKTSNIH